LSGDRLRHAGPALPAAIGSSSTAGVGASSPAGAYPLQLEAVLERLVDGAEIAVENAGVGGETADQTVSRLEQALLQPAKPDLVIWQVGTNDAVRGGDETRFRALLERGIAAVRRAGAELILLDPQFYPTIPDLPRYERYVRIIAAVAAEAKLKLFSRYRMMREWDRSGPEALAGMLAKDRFHMGDRGYRCLAEALGREIGLSVGPALSRTLATARTKRISPAPSGTKRS
jgi:lysophospholipase L1-like esterase